VSAFLTRCNKILTIRSTATEGSTDTDTGATTTPEQQLQNNNKNNKCNDNKNNRQKSLPESRITFGPGSLHFEAPYACLAHQLQGRLKHKPYRDVLDPIRGEMRRAEQRRESSREGRAEGGEEKEEGEEGEQERKASVSSKGK
jgi:hypothetical protein